MYGEGTKGEYLKVAYTVQGAGVLGCLAWECCPSGFYFAGYWTGSKNGFVSESLESISQE